MPTLRSHTHLQAAQAKTQIQSLQRQLNELRGKTQHSSVQKDVYGN